MDVSGVLLRGGDLYLTDGAFNSVGNGSNYISSTIDTTSGDNSKVLILGFNGQNTLSSALSARKNGGFVVRSRRIWCSSLVIVCRYFSKSFIMVIIIYH